MPESFSIVIPTFQRRDVVVDAVTALTGLRYGGWLEVIVVVDGSTDGTGEALGELDTPWPLTVLRQPNSGAAAARNAGAAAAAGQFLLFLDDDMIAAPDLVARHALSLRGGADAVMGHIPVDPASARTFLGRGAGDWAEERRTRLSRPGAEPSFLDVMTGQLSVRREVFEALDGFSRAFTADGAYGNEDLDFGRRLLDAGFRLAFDPDAVSHQRYVVTPADHLRQRRQAGHADVAFARIHPRCASELFTSRGHARASTRLLAALARLPGAADAAARLALAATRNGGAGRGPVRLVPRLFRHCRDLAYWRGVHEAGGIPGDNPLTVLCYHSISELGHDPVLGPYAVAPRTFARHMHHLRERGCNFVSGKELAAFLSGDAGLPRRAVLVTFDDCYVDFERAAVPILAELGIPALAFAVSGLAGRTNEWDRGKGGSPLALLGFAELKALSESGVEIGAHSRRHPRLAGQGRDRLSVEVAGSADDLAAAGLPRPRYFAYPYGVHDAASRKAVEAAGFTGAFALGDRRARPLRTPMAIPRIEITARDVGWRFALKVSFPQAARLLSRLVPATAVPEPGSGEASRRSEPTCPGFP